MGIPGFNTWFYDNNKQAYVPLHQVKVDHLYIDMNSLLHNALRNARNLDQYHEILYKRLDKLLNVTQPRKSVMMAIDGPAPLAKLMTQRARRKKSFVSEERKKAHGRSSGGGHKKPRGGSFTSSTALTPGTPFMHDVCVSVSHFVCAKLGQGKWSHLEFEVSGPTVAGEGEVKVLGRLARPRYPASVSPTDTHMIVGDDADLILMALVSSTPRLHILNASLMEGGSNSSSSKHGKRLSQDTAVLSVDRLHAVWLAAANGAANGQRHFQHKGNKQQQQHQAIVVEELGREQLLELLGSKADLALLAILSNGNDYLPAVRGCPKLQILWESYTCVRQRPEFRKRSIITMVQQPQQTSSTAAAGTLQHSRALASEARLDCFLLAEVLAVAQQGWKKYYGTQDASTHKKRAKQHLPQQQQEQIDWGAGGAPLLHDDAQEREFSSGPVAAAAATAAAAMLVDDKEHHAVQVSVSGGAAEALPWIKGLLWCISMYFAGDCPDYRWCFAGPAPDLAGLVDLGTVTAAAAAAAVASRSGSTGSASPRDAVEASAHLLMGLHNFPPPGAAADQHHCSSDSSTVLLSGPSISAFTSAIAAAYQRRLLRLSRRTTPLSDPSASAGFEALPPHICSLALLPPGALEHVPSSLQHLMLEGSPVYDMYKSCPECEQAGQAVYEATVAHQLALTRVNDVVRMVTALARQEGIAIDTDAADARVVNIFVSSGVATATVAAGAMDVPAANGVAAVDVGSAGASTDGDASCTGDSDAASDMDTDCDDRGDSEGDDEAALAACMAQEGLSAEMRALLEQREAARAAREACKDAMQDAIEARRVHEQQAHPEGVDVFDLARLEAAVAAIPASQIERDQQALTQTSLSMMFRLGQEARGLYQQQHGLNSTPQQQQQRGYQQQANGYQQLPQALFRAPPPACRGSYTAASARNLLVSRSVLAEDAFSCRVQEDRHMWRYSRYLTAGPRGTPADGQRDRNAPQRTGSGVSGGNQRAGVGRLGQQPAHAHNTPAPAAAVQTSEGWAAQTGVQPMEVDAAAAALERTGLRQQQQQQQQSGRRPASPRSKRSRDTPAGAGSGAGAGDSSSLQLPPGAAAAAVVAQAHQQRPSSKHGTSRARSPSPQHKRQERLDANTTHSSSNTNPSATASAPSSGRQQQQQKGSSGRQPFTTGYGPYALGPPPPPAPKNIPLPGTLLSRRAGSSGALAGRGPGSSGDRPPGGPQGAATDTSAGLVAGPQMYPQYDQGLGGPQVNPQYNQGLGAPQVNPQYNQGLGGPHVYPQYDQGSGAPQGYPQYDQGFGRRQVNPQYNQGFAGPQVNPQYDQGFGGAQGYPQYDQGFGGPQGYPQGSRTQQQVGFSMSTAEQQVGGLGGSVSLPGHVLPPPAAVGGWRGAAHGAAAAAPAVATGGAGAGTALPPPMRPVPPPVPHLHGTYAAVQQQQQHRVARHPPHAAMQGWPRP